MSVRSMLEQNPIYVAVGACVIMAIAAYIILTGSSRGGEALTSSWAYDLNTGALLIARPDQLPPFDTDSGTFAYPGMSVAGAGVYAQIYTCGRKEDIRVGMTADELANVGARFLTVARFTDEALNALNFPMDEESNQPRVDLTQSLILSDLTGQDWYPEQSRPAIELRQIALERCDSGEYPVLAIP